MSKNIISIESLKKAFSEKIITAEQTFGIHEGDKIGLIGINGCGKSTFLKMLAGSEQPDSGAITFRSGLKIAYLPQIPVLDDTLTVFEQIYYSEKPEFVVLREFNRLCRQENTESKRLKELLQQIEEQNLWDIESKAKQYLTKLGLPNFEEKTGNLSGGQRRRLDLARILMDEPDILFLDEPTNHLDIETIEWFQDYLLDFKGSLVFVTHDRYFLDAVSNRILEIEKGVFRFYEGNYSTYVEKKQLEMQDLQRKETRRQAQLQKELKWLRRGARARATKPKDHVERVKELLSKSYLTSEAELEIAFKTERLGKTILEAKKISKAFGSKKLLSEFNHIFQKLERIGIVGPNGCGKTTLIKILTEEILPDSGSVKKGINTKFAYFKQEEESLSSNIKVIDYIREDRENIRMQNGELHSASEMLERFLFDGKMQQQPVSSLSGGEKKRLYLLKSLMGGCNFLILDEPTNDLDLKTLEILEDYLDAFKGCLVVVSHDRFFLDRTVDDLFVFDGQKITKFPGNYSDWLLVRRYETEEKKEVKEPELRRSGKPKLSFNQKRELGLLEKEISLLEKELDELTEKITNDSQNLSADDFAHISERQNQIEQLVAEKSERWFILKEKEEGATV